MTYTATVTKQGQISIPAKIRRKYGINKNSLVILDDRESEGVFLKPVPDIMSLAGIFKSKKKFTHKEERRAFEHYLATRHLGNRLI